MLWGGRDEVHKNFKYAETQGDLTFFLYWLQNYFHKNVTQKVRDFFAFIEDTFKICVKAFGEGYYKLPVEPVQISSIKILNHQQHKTVRTTALANLPYPESLFHLFV